MLQSFSMGRKINPSENTDETINTQIENTIHGVWFRRPRKNVQKLQENYDFWSK